MKVKDFAKLQYGSRWVKTPSGKYLTADRSRIPFVCNFCHCELPLDTYHTFKLMEDLCATSSR